MNNVVEEPEPVCNCHQTGERCPETGWLLTECNRCGEGILEEDEIVEGYPLPGY